MAEIDKTITPTKLLWVDLEMTGLDPRTDVIIEVAAIVTDFRYRTLDTYEAVIFQSDDVLATANEWSKNQHAASGLLERVRTQGRPETDVVHEFVGFITQHFGDEPAVLAGNSIHADRAFIRRWWPEVNELLHYRMLDVSSWKVVLQGMYGLQFDKGPETHRAADDITNSIAELTYYISWLRGDGS